jgi:hypothetical protein
VLFGLTPFHATSTMIGMKFRPLRPLRLVTALVLLLIACSTPTTTSLSPESALPDGVQGNRSGLWTTKVFATFPTFIDEAHSSVPALAPEQTMLEGQPEGMTPNPILSECAGIVWFSDGSTQATPWKPCSTGFNPKDLLKWFKSWPR